MIKKIIYLCKYMSDILNKQQKIICIIVFICSCFGALLECLGVSVIIPFVSVLIDESAIRENEYIQRISIIRDVSYTELVIILCAFVILVYLFKNAYFIFLSWLRIKFSAKIQREISVKILNSYLSRGYEFFLGKNFGELYRGVATDPSAMYSLLFNIFRFISETLTIALICAFMFLTDWKLALTVFIMALLCLAIIYFFFRKSMYKAGLQDRKYTTEFYQDLVQIFQGSKDVLLYRKQRFFVNEYESNLIMAQQAQCKTVVGGESPSYVIEGLCVSGLLAMVGVRVIDGISLEFVSVLAAFAVGAFRILPSLGRISAAVNGMMNSIPSISALYDQIIETDEYVSIHPNFDMRETEPRSKGLIDRHKKFDESNDLSEDLVKSEMFYKELLIKNISFRYSGTQQSIIENLNLRIRKGESVALIGTSGAGKSTLADLILGLLIPQQGAIYMDGVDISSIPDKWAQTIGYVPQSVFLSDASIEENVAFGVSKDRIDKGRMKEAIRRAELEEFVDSLPDGLATFVGDRGVRLSGGQRQRIAIARALYRRPEILVLDEATSALDNDTETAIMSAIDSLQGQVTLIIVAHRLTTVRNCDVIYEVRNKGIIKRDKQDVLKNC